jgi:hypothetical protein
MKKILIPLTLATFMVGCATHKPVSHLPAKWRVDDKAVTTGMPNYPLAPEVFARVQKQTPGRAPASSDQELAAAIEADEKKTITSSHVFPLTLSIMAASGADE